ncbi:MAG: DNA-processing protein DprA [Acidimicrobiia bacterium]
MARAESTEPSELSEQQVAAATLACLPQMTPARLRRLLDEHRGPIGALRAVGHGWAGIASWRDAAERLDLAARLRARGTRVWIDGDAGYPIGEGVADPPPVLLGEGDVVECLGRPRVAIVGTRAATPHGLADAADLGAFLAHHGVVVVSGLAIGIDAAAHTGALDAGGTAIGVVATGLDVVYPRRHCALFDRVRARGVIVSETGFGVAPSPSRFPVRNRIIAALADVVVVVEATARGGARITAERALDYDRPVLAMPGSRRNPSAAGCNALLADGAHPLLEPEDVLLALGLTPGARRGWDPGATERRRPTGLAARLHRAFGGEPASLDQLATRADADLDEVTVALHQLEQYGWVEQSRGLWWPSASP